MTSSKLLSLTELQRAELNLLVVFDELCKSHSLRYSLQAGTLIGAVRHKGFIPWDDDIDVSMPRPDVEELLRIKKQLPEGYDIEGPENTKFAAPFYKFVDLGIIAQEPHYEGIYREHLWIDIFPMDGASIDKQIVRKKQNEMTNAIRWVAWTDARPKLDPLWKRVAKSVAAPILRLMNPRKRMIGLAKEIADDPGYEKAERISSFMGGSRSGWSISKAEYEDMVELEFEGHLFRAMGCWDEYLRTCYGNYMQLPPEEQRITHHLKAWRVN